MKVSRPISPINTRKLVAMARAGIRWKKSGFEYSATKVFEYSNTYEYASLCFVKNKTPSRVILT